MKEIIFSHNFILKEKLAQYIIGLILIISGEILHSCMVTYMPAFAISILTDNGEFSAIVIYILISNIIIIIANRIEKKANKIVNNNRIIRSQEYYKIICKTNYENIDRYKFKAKYEAGQESFYDGFHSGFHNMILDSRKLLLGITGLVVYCTLEARVDFRIALLQVALSSVSLWLNTLQKKWISDNQVEWQGLEVKIKNINRDVIDIKNAKDIRIYSAKSWILQK